MDGNQPDINGLQPPIAGDHTPEDKVQEEKSIPMSGRPQETVPNGNATTENASGKKKNKPGNITITENGDQEESSIQSPLSPLRSYGGMHPTELLLLSPVEESPPIMPSKHKAVNVPPSDDQEPQDTCCIPPDVENEIIQKEAPVPTQEDATECGVMEDVVLEEKPCEDEVDSESQEKEAEKEDSVQEKDSHGNDQVEKEVLTSENTLPSLPELPETVIEVDVDGVSSEEVLPVLTGRQKTAREAILVELEKQFESGDTENEENKKACCRGCITDDCCLQSCTCTIGNPFSRGNRKTPIKKQQPLLTDELRKGRAKGLSDFKKAIFPLIPDLLRMVWVIFELAVVIVGLVLSVITLSLDQNRAFNIIHLVLIIISTLLALIDGIFTLKNSKTCKKLCSKCKADQNKQEENETEEGCCGKCYSHCSNLSDVMRLILSEVIFYPLLVCDIFELIVGRGFEGKTPGDIVGILLFVLSLVSMILTVYVARIVVLIGMVKNATAVRTPNSKMIQEDAQQEESVYDSEIRKSALWYQASFCVHVILQMLSQLMMYIAIAAKIRYDNRHFYEVGNTDESLHVSGNLGYMIFAGYVMPTLGLFTFFIVTYYWSQQYPIGYRIDMMSIFKMTEYGMIDVLSIKEAIKEKAEKMEKQLHEKVEGKKAAIIVDNLLNIGLKPLKADFDELFNKSWLDKFALPFKTPTLVITCLSYAVLQLAFVICAAQAVDDMGVVVTQILNGGGWVIYYIIAVIVGVIANLYVFLVAGLWVAIVSAIIITIAAIIACLILACMLANCGSSKPRSSY